MKFFKRYREDLPTVIHNVAVFVRSKDGKTFEFETEDKEVIKTLKKMGYHVVDQEETPKEKEVEETPDFVPEKSKKSKGKK